MAPLMDASISIVICEHSDFEDHLLYENKSVLITVPKATALSVRSLPLS